MKKGYYHRLMPRIVSAFVFTLLMMSFILPAIPAHAAPADAYWVAGTGNWSDATNHWAIVSNGAPGAGNTPDQTTNVHFDSHSFSGAGQVVTVDAGGNRFCANMDWTGATNNPNLTLANSLLVYGSVVLTSNMTWTGAAQQIRWNGAGSYTLTTNGVSLASTQLGLISGGLTGNVTLLDDLAGPQTLNLEGGGLNTNGKVVTVGEFAISSASAKILNLGSSVINVIGGGTGSGWAYTGSSLTWTPGTSSIRLINTSGLAPLTGFGVTYN